MNTNDRWLLPEGIDEALPETAAWLETARRQLIDLYQGWGYRLVMPPFIEYLDSLLTGSSHDLDLQTFKLTDQLSGRMMGLRADMTPQVARIDAHRLRENQPTRLCYLGTVLTTRPAGFAGSRSPLQVGAELYGHEGIGSDSEILRLMLETLQCCGIDSVHVDLGHVGIFRAVARASGLDARQTETLFDMMQRKSNPEIQTFLVSLKLDPEAQQGLSQLASLHGGEEILKPARDILGFAGTEVSGFITTLEKLATTIKNQFPKVIVNYDLSELRGYHYETGAVFAAYVPGEGQEIARGGRYDGVGREFGRSRSAVGFSVDLKTLQRISTLKFENSRRMIWAPEQQDPDLSAAIRQLRAAGDCVVCALDGQDGARTFGCSYRLVKQSDQWVVKEIT